MDNSTVATPGANASALEYNALRVDAQTGWIKPCLLTGGIYVDDSWTYSSVSGQIGTVSVTSDGRERYEVGMKVRFKQGGSYKYFVITAVNETSISISGGSSYTLTNSSITDLYVSNWRIPLDWPFDDDIYFSDVDGATITFDRDVSKLHTVTLGGNRTLALSNMAVGDRIILRLVQDGTGSRTVTWFSTIKWGGGSAPTLATTANRVDVFGFLCTSAGNYDGYIIEQNMS